MRTPTTAVFLAHPGHELLIHGWLREIKPRVYVVTDGGGHSGEPRLAYTARLLESLGVPQGCIFGRLSDQQAYSAILDNDVALIGGLAAELARDLVASRITRVIADAAEGHNPVHDLCRVIVGAASVLAAKEGIAIEHYEYSIVRGPHYFRESNDTFVHMLDTYGLKAKLDAARANPALFADMQVGIQWFGEEAFRREAFHLVEQWNAPAWDGNQAAYDRVGEQRVEQQRYNKVIRYAQHMLPLQARFNEWLTAQCAF